MWYKINQHQVFIIMTLNASCMTALNLSHCWTFTIALISGCIMYIGYMWASRHFNGNLAAPSCMLDKGFNLCLSEFESVTMKCKLMKCQFITEICAELLLARWAQHFDYNSPAGNFWVVAGSNDPWRCALANPSMGSWINSAGVLPHFAEDDPSVEALEGGRTVRQWIT